MSVKFDQGVGPTYLSDGYPSRQISQERLEELKEQSHKALLENLPVLQESFRKMHDANKRIDEGQKELLIATEKHQAATERLEKADIRLQQSEKKLQDALTRMFYRIFNSNTPIPVDEINVIFNTYLKDNSLTIEENSLGEGYAKINSMRAVTRYLDDHPTVKACDFRAFKTEVHDIGTLAEYLKTSTVKGIALKNGIPLESKEILSKAVAARSGGLVVKYFA